MGRSGWSRAARGAASVVAAVAVVAVLLLFVFPTRTYLDQRHQLSFASQRLRVLRGANAQLAAQVDKLHSDVEIERLARERYHLVRPGEQAFAILPAPSSTAASPGVASPTSRSAVRPHRAGLWQRVTAWL